MDYRIIRILNNGGYEGPTILQKSIIPLALQGKNIIAETDKGAGKIASYIIPSIISLENSEPGLKILVIASSVEDLREISEQFKLFMGKDADKISVVTFSKKSNTKGELAILGNNPDILLSTPNNIIDHLRLGNFDIERIRTCIVDCGEMPYDGFSNDVEFILTGLSRKTRLWIFTEDREKIPFFHRLLQTPSIIYSECGVRETEQEKKKMEINAEQEKIYSELIKKIIKSIKEDEDANEMNQFKKLVKKNVPFTLRSYFSAYLFKNMVINSKGGNSNTANRADKDYKTLFFNIGRTRGLNPQALLRFIIAGAEVDGSDVGQIKVHDNYSFVDIAEPNVQKVMDSLTGKVYRGRTLAVNFAKKNEPAAAPAPQTAE